MFALLELAGILLFLTSQDLFEIYGIIFTVLKKVSYSSTDPQADDGSDTEYEGILGGLALFIKMPLAFHESMDGQRQMRESAFRE